MVGLKGNTKGNKISLFEGWRKVKVFDWREENGLVPLILWRDEVQIVTLHASPHSILSIIRSEWSFNDPCSHGHWSLIVGGALDKWSSPHLHIMGEILRRDEMQNSNPESYQIRSRQRLISFPSGFRAEISNFLFLINVNSVIRRGFLQILRWFISREMNRVSNIIDKNAIKSVCYCGVELCFSLHDMSQVLGSNWD